jgi:hypothetical protein
VDPGTTLGIVILIVVLTAYAAFQQWLRHQRRLIVHRERLAAIEKGAELPNLEWQVQGASWNVQRLLLLAGLVWISVGLGTYLLLNSLAGQRPLSIPVGFDATGPMWVAVQIRDGMQWIGATLIAIGLSHLVVYAIGKRKEP